MLKYSLFTIGIFLVSLNSSWCIKRNTSENSQHKLVLSRRSFLRFIDEDRLLSYLSSFGENPSAEESRQHAVYKRASGRVKKLKKTPSTDAAIESDNKNQRVKTAKKIEAPTSPKNFTISPRHMIKFELEDAKYDEEYEKMRKNRKLRVKRSADDSKNQTNSRVEKFISHEAFTQPQEILKFVYTDAIISTEVTDNKKTKTDTKTKREVNAADLAASDTRKIKITHPLSSSARTKHVTYEELSVKMQKIVESAIIDAVSKGKASEGDFLKFYYGDKIFKVAVSLSKHIAALKDTTSKPYSDHYIKTVKYHKEESVTEHPKLLATKNTYAKYQSFLNHHESSDYSSEKAKSYANFITPIRESPILKVVEDVEVPKLAEYVPKKSIYYYSSTDEVPTTPAPVKYEHSILHSKPVLHTSIFNNKLRDVIPITEDFNESNLSIPASIPIYPTSYIEYDDNNYQKPLNVYEDKNYAFGYHVSDYKTGNNFGHTQVKNNKEIKGEYSILLPDGRVQTTKYFADDSGFHADVSYQNVH